MKKIGKVWRRFADKILAWKTPKLTSPELKNLREYSRVKSEKEKYEKEKS